MNCRKFLLIMLFIVFNFLISFSQPKNDNHRNETIQKINNYLSEIEKAGFYGAVLVGLNNEIAISKGFGLSNKTLQITNSPNTIFDIGSITKQFTATAILKLEMQGKLNVDDKITLYFNNVPADKQNITIHDLLRHQSGLISNVGKDFEKISKEDFILKVMESKLRFEVASDFSYSNIGYSLLAMIIEKVSGVSYETFIYENLFKPSGMEITGYIRPSFDTTLIATGYDRYEKPWGKPTDHEWDTTAPYWHLTGNGGILSTTGDLFKWDNALNSDKILNKSAKEKLYHPKIRSGENANAIYAYGWDVSQTSRNTRRVWHNGSNRIFYADFMRYIDEGIVIITLSNKSHPFFNGLSMELSKIIFNNNYVPEIPVIDNEANRDFTKMVIETIKESGLEVAKNIYAKKSKDTHLIEYDMRNAGFNFIDNNQPETAILVFEMNAFAFPNSARALQGLGEGYMETGKKDLAIIYLRKSLAINSDNPFLVNMLNELETNK